MNKVGLYQGKNIKYQSALHGGRTPSNYCCQESAFRTLYHLDETFHVFLVSPLFIGQMVVVEVHGIPAICAEAAAIPDNFGVDIIFSIVLLDSSLSMTFDALAGD